MIETANVKKKFNNLTRGRSEIFQRVATATPEGDPEKGQSSTKHVRKLMETKFENKVLHKDMHAIFAFNSPTLFFKQVELALFLQCVFISFTFTELIPMAYRETYGTSAAWAFSYLLPIVVNFYIFRSTLYTSVQILAIIELDKDIFGLVAEEAEVEKVMLLL